MCSSDPSTITIQNVAKAAETRVFAGGVIGRVDSVTFKLRCKSLTVGGGITSDATEYAYVGGLVGIIKNENSTREANHWTHNYSLFHSQAVLYNFQLY